MKNLIAIALLLAFAGCGTDTSGEFVTTPNPTQTITAQTPSIQNNWVNNDSTSPIPALNFSQVQLNAQVSADTVLSCPTAGDVSGTSSPVGFFGVTKGNVYVNGSATDGIIQFGQLSHPAKTGECYVVGQEAYDYTVSGTTLTLCDVTYQVCSVFTQN